MSHSRVQSSVLFGGVFTASPKGVIEERRFALQRNDNYFRGPKPKKQKSGQAQAASIPKVAPQTSQKPERPKPVEKTIKTPKTVVAVSSHEIVIPEPRAYKLSDEIDNFIRCLNPKLKTSLTLNNEYLEQDSHDFLMESIGIFYRYDALHDSSSYSDDKLNDRREFLLKLCGSSLHHYSLSPDNLKNLENEFNAHREFIKLDNLTQHRINNFILSLTSSFNSFVFRKRLKDFQENNGEVGERILSDLMFLSTRNKFKLHVEEIIPYVMSSSGKDLTDLGDRLSSIRGTLSKTRGIREATFENSALRNGHADVLVTLRGGEKLLVVGKPEDKFHTLRSLSRFADRNHAKLVFAEN